MDIGDRVRDLAARAEQQLPHIQTEEATKLALINPFIREVLGYNTADLTEVVPEYTSDVGTKKGEKVDYAILRDGVPLILIEAKKAGTTLHVEEPSQLYRYFTATHSARFGIYTDGIKYFFYSDLDRPNLMDQRPFLVLDLMDIDPSVLDEVAKFVKSEFNPEEIHASANQLKYLRLVKIELQSELADPSDEMVKLLMTRVYTGLRTKQRLDQFKAITKSAARQVVREELRDKLNSALASDDAPSTGSKEAPPDDIRNDTSEDEIITTEAELSGYYAVKAILHDRVDPRRIAIRDAKYACSILLDDTNRKPICKLWFGRKQKYLGVFDEDRKETRLPIESIDDIFMHAEALRTTVARYEPSQAPSAS